jgi:hypothetical protein
MVILHFSIGSAANSTHCSVDVELDDPKINEVLDKTMEVWEKTRLARKKYDERWN